MMARKPDEAEAGFAIGIYEQGIIESNADERFGRSGDPEDRQWAEEEGLFNSDAGTREGTITEKGWDLLNDDVAKIEKNAMAWMKHKFLDARDEGHSDDLVGTFWFDPLNPDQAQLVDLAADTGRQERIDMVDPSYGDLADTAFDGVSDFGASVLGGGITFFDVKPEDMAIVEQTLEVQRRRDPRAREARLMVREAQRGPYIVHVITHGGPPTSHARAERFDSIRAARAHGAALDRTTPASAEISIGDKYGNRLEVLNRRSGQWHVQPSGVAHEPRRPAYAPPRPTRRRQPPARRR